MSGEDRTAFLLDVDNTLLDNDRIEADFSAHLEREIGAAGRDRYWKVFEERRADLGYADYLGALQCYRAGESRESVADPRLMQLSSFLLDYAFADRLYPGALDAVAQIGRWGRVVIVSDGDAVFQPRKIQRSGLWDAVGGQVLIYIHKETVVADLTRRYPARHYVVADDKLRILSAMKRSLGRRLTTVFVRQGHFAMDPGAVAAYPPADLTFERIGDLRYWDGVGPAAESGAAPIRLEK